MVKHWIVAVVFFVLSPYGIAANLPIDKTAQTDSVIRAIFEKIANNSSLPERITQVSQEFLDKPYLLGPLGEGKNGKYDQFPLYRTDAFDCLTYVETVMALSLASNAASFNQCLQAIRYHQGNISFIARNHFTDLDWNLNNQYQGFLQDITGTIHDKQQRPVAQLAEALINKPAWYQKMPLTRIRLQSTSLQEQHQQWLALKREGAKLSAMKVKIPYLPLSALIDAHDKANLYVLRQIPEGAIIEIVRPNWDLTAVIGTHLNVSHLGFAVWKNDLLYFRNASTLKGKVVDQLLEDYLREARKNPTIQGINVQMILQSLCPSRS